MNASAHLGAKMVNLHNCSYTMDFTLPDDIRRLVKEIEDAENADIYI